MTSSRIRALLGFVGILGLAVCTAGAESVQGGSAQTNTPPVAGIESQPLAVPEVQLIGLIDSETDGFSRDLWSGASHALVETLLARLSPSPSSPATADLARRLLLSRADPPRGPRSRSLLPARLERLLALGDLQSIEPLAQLAPADLLRAEVLAARVDALFYQDTDKEACALAESVRGRAGDAGWIKRLAYCDAIAGRIGAARMGADVLADSGDADSSFAALMARLVDKAPGREAAPEHPSAVHLALLRQTGLPLAQAALDRAGPAFLAAWASSDKAPLAQRIIAGERAASSGALGTTALLGLYRSVPINPQRLATPFDDKPLGGVEGTAFAIQRVAIADEASERAKLIAAALRSARDRGVMPAVAKAFAPDLAAIPATDALAELGPILAAGEVLAGSGHAARRWLDLVRTLGKAGREPALALRSLLAVGASEVDLNWSTEEMLARVQGAALADRLRAGLEWEMVHAMGLAGGSEMALVLMDGPLTAPGVAPIPAVLAGLEDASARRQVGATVLYALAALGETGPRGAHPLAISGVVRALHRIGLDRDARAIATEALVWRMP